MDDPQRPSTPPERGNDYEPVARWENEGGAYDERDAAARLALQSRPPEMARRRAAYEASSPWWAESPGARIEACSQTPSSLSARSLRPPLASTEPPPNCA